MSNYKPGEKIAGYKVEEDIGGGGQGHVYSLGGDRVIKVMVLKDEKLEYFKKIVEKLEKIEHPWIVKVETHGTVSSSALGDEVYCVMEFISKEALKDLYTEWSC